MTLILSNPNGQPNQVYRVLTENQTPLEVQAVETDLNSCSAVQGTTTADILAALATGAAEICFPPAVYDVTALVAQSQANQVLNFQAGAVLRFAASGAGRLQLNGDGAAIIGRPVARWDAASAVAYTAIDVHGIGSSSVGWRFEVNANLSNASTRLMLISGDHAEVGNCVATGVGAVAGIMIDQAHRDDTEVEFPVLGRMKWLPVDDGVTTRTFGTIVRYKGRYGEFGGLECNTGGRSVVGQVLDMVGHLWQIQNPQVFCTQADWGLRIRDGAEFLEIFGGEFHQSSDGVSARAGSQGIEFGEGSVKLYGTKFIGWDFNARFTGSCDTCGFYGSVFANGKTANLEVDSGANPISGLGLFSCYFECEAVPTCINIHLKTGSVLGMSIEGGQQAWGGINPGDEDTSIVCEAGFGGGDVQLGGTRFQASNVTDAVTEPNATTRFLFGYHSFFGSNNISKGANAAKATSIDALANTSLATKSLTISTLTAPGDAILGQWVDFFTANFGAGIGANTFVELDFPFAEVTAINKFVVAWTLVGTLAANGSLLFTCYIHDPGFIRLRATNVTGVGVGAIAGTLFATVQKVLA
jgi:hypothetical protein